MILAMASNIGCDQISKNIAREKLDYYEPIHLANDFLTLIKVENTGAFLSLGDSLPQPIKVILLTIVPLIVLVLACLYLLTRKDLTKMLVTGMCFIIGGGIGNIYDRVVYGSVTDFLHIDFGIFQTGIFNMADVSVMTGAIMILIGMQFGRTKLNSEGV